MELEYKTIEFYPANEKQKRFMNSDTPFLLLSGATECGKTYPGCWKIFKQALNYPGGRFFVCRKEATSLQNSTLVTLFEIIPKELIIKRNDQKGYVDIRTKDPKYPSRIVWFGLDKKAGQDYPTKIGSTEFISGFFDETIEGDEGDFQMLTTRLRYRIKHLTEEENKKIPRQLFGATNPDSPTHFLYSFFFKTNSLDREVIMMTPYENPYCTPDRLKRMEETLTGLRKERLLLGRWVQAEGAIYDTFDFDKNVFNDVIIDLSKYKEIIGGADSNFPIPRAGVIIGITANRELHIIKEFYETNAKVEKLAEWFSQFAVSNNISITVYHDPSDPEAIDTINNYKNINCIKAINSVIPGISCVHKFITEANLKVHKSCVNSIQYIGAYRWKKGKKDEPDKVNDHLPDAIRYSVFSFDNRDEFLYGELNSEEIIISSTDSDISHYRNEEYEED